MIIDVLFLLVSTFFNLLFIILASFNFLLPVQVEDAITWAFSYAYYLDLVLPVATLMWAFGVFLTFMIFWFSTKRLVLPLLRNFFVKFKV